MRYLTREWYDSMQTRSAIFRFEPIADKPYTEAEIRDLYRDALNKLIEDERRMYDHIMNFSEADLARMSVHAPKNDDGSYAIPSFTDEAAAQFNAQLALSIEEQKKSLTFDPKKIERKFRAMCRQTLKLIGTCYPKWLIDEVDLRLISYGYLTKSAYDRLEAECSELEREHERILREYDEECRRQSIPEAVHKALKLHDDTLLSLRKRGKNLEMYMLRCGYFGGDASPYRRVTFKDAVVLLKERGLLPRIEFDRADKVYGSQILLLYWEIYRSERGYEVHMMFINLKTQALPYLTVDCSDVLYEDGVAFAKPAALEHEAEA